MVRKCCMFRRIGILEKEENVRSVLRNSAALTSIGSYYSHFLWHLELSTGTTIKGFQLET